MDFFVLQWQELILGLYDCGLVMMVDAITRLGLLA